MFLSEEIDLGQAFRNYFEIVPAFSEALKDEAYRVRHQVYCEDLGFEPVRADRRETDEHDAHSLHLLIRNINTREFVGCTRIVRPRMEDPNYQLPFERACGTALDRSMVDPAKFPPHSICEVSRLAVIASYRRRKGEALRPVSITDEDFGSSGQPRFPFIPIGLYLATTVLAQLNGIETVFVLTEKRLAKHFSKLGFALKVIGNSIDHHGERIPSLMSVSGTIANMRENLQPLFHVITEDIEKAS